MAVNTAPTFTATTGTGRLIDGIGILAYAVAYAVQTDGKILVLDGLRLAILRYNSDGSPDTSFGVNGSARGVGLLNEYGSIAVQSDGKIVVGGTARYENGFHDFGVYRCNADGSPDTSFGVDGTATAEFGDPNENGWGVVVQSDGKIVLVGSGPSASGLYTDFALARFNTDGSLDTSFGDAGKVQTGTGVYEEFLAVIQQGDGKLIAIGFQGGNFAIGRYMPDGSLDGSFGDGGVAAVYVGAFPNACAATAQADGKIIVAGYAKIDAARDMDFVVIRLNADGSLDTSFGVDGKVYTDFGGGYDTVFDVEVLAGGKILVTGTTTDANDYDFSAMARYHPDGSPDLSLDGGSTTNTLQGAAPWTENSIYYIPLDTSVAIYDAELAALDNYGGSSLTLARQGGPSSEDNYAILGSPDADAGDVNASGVTVGTYVKGGGVLYITFNGDATQARVNEVLSGIGYYHDSEAPPPSVKLVWTFNDGNDGDAQGTGGALSGVGTKTITMQAINDAPVLDAAFSPAFTAIPENTANTTGTSVASLVADGSITDADGVTVEAIAIIGLNTSLGTWQYSLDNGGNWLTMQADLINSAADEQALLLGPTALIRLVTLGMQAGTLSDAITFRAWDQTSGTAGDYVSITATGVKAPFSEATDTASITVFALNIAPTGQATISGTPTQGEVVSAGNNIADADGLGPISYQWRANGQNVGTGATLQLTQAQVGKTITVVASYTDGRGTVEHVISAATAAVANVNDVPTGAIAITGTAVENQVLAANTAALSDVDGLGTLHFQWQRNDGAGFMNVGIDQSTYTLADADIGGVVRVVTSYLDLQATQESVTSAQTQPVTAFNDPHTGGASITGMPIEDQVLTAVSSLADVDGLGSLHFQWQHDVGSGFVDVGTDQPNYTLDDTDVGGSIRVVISYVDGQGFSESATSTSVAIAGVNDPHTGGAAISGTAAEDEVLTAVSTLADVDGLGTLHYQWQRDTGSGFTNVGTDQSTYSLGDGDVGGVVRVVISYTDLQGNLEAATSGATAAVTAVNDTSTGSVTITGTVAEDQMLTADTSTLADSDGLGTLHYQWERDTGSGFANVGADQATHTLGDADVGAVIRLKVSYTDGQGFSNSVTSAKTAPVANVNDAPLGMVTVTGTLAQGRTLTASNSLADIDGVGTITYRWQADGVDIGGATGASLVLTAAQVGKAITAVASYTDEQGTEEEVSSSTSAPVSADGDAPLATRFSPQDEDGSVLPSSSIVLTFNETVVAGAGNIVLKTSTGAIVETFNVASSSQLTFGGTTLTIDPSSNLGSGVGYRVEFAAGSVLDLAGNAFAGAPGYNFATPSRPINGTGGNDTLLGTEGDDILDGRSGADRMAGRLGDDTYRVDSLGDVVVEQPGGGTDHVIVDYPYLPFSTYTLGANVENLTLGNWPLTFLPYALNGTGNELNNALTGNNAANNLAGLGGADTLFGGLGGDRFVYRSVSDSGTARGSSDVIGDFNRAQGDKIDLQAIDANVSSYGNQAFVFIGANAFGANATSRVRFDSVTHMLYGSTDADADAEFAIELAGVATLLASDILL